MKIGVFQLVDKGYAEAFRPVMQHISDYCKKYDIDHHPMVGPLNGSGNCHINYQKPLLLLKHIHNYDYVIWLDADVMVANWKKTFEEIIKEFDRDIYFCDDPGGWFFNSGVLIFKNCEKSKSVLQKWWEDRCEGTSKHWRLQDPSGGTDQLSLIKIIKEMIKNGDKDLGPINPLVMNCHPRMYERGVFLLHFMDYWYKDICALVQSSHNGGEDFFLAFRDLVPSKTLRNLHRLGWDPINMAEMLRFYKTIRLESVEHKGFIEQKTWFEQIVSNEGGFATTTPDPWKNYII